MRIGRVQEFRKFRVLLGDLLLRFECARVFKGDPAMGGRNSSAA